MTRLNIYDFSICFFIHARENRKDTKILNYILSTGVMPNKIIPLWRICLTAENKANLAIMTSLSSPITRKTL